jgi:hypothetical protein
MVAGTATVPVTKIGCDSGGSDGSEDDCNYDQEDDYKTTAGTRSKITLMTMMTTTPTITAAGDISHAAAVTNEHQCEPLPLQ